MRNNSWFPLLLRAIGVYWILGPATRFLETIVWLAQHALDAETESFSSVTWWSRSVPSLFALTLQTGAAIYLLLGAPGFVRWCFKQAALRCPGCDCIVAGLTGTSCPECGAAIAPQSAAESAPGSSSGGIS